MSTKTNGVAFNKSSKAKNRRKAAISRLEVQLEYGHKPDKEHKSIHVPLTETDVKRINRELETLLTRI